MKRFKTVGLLAVTAFVLALSTSCTKQSLDENEQLIDPDKVEVPTNG